MLTCEDPGDFIQSERISVLQILNPGSVFLSIFKVYLEMGGKHIPFITYSCPEDEQPWTPEPVSLPVPWVSAQPLSDGELTPFPTVKPFLLFPDRFSLLVHCELALNSQSMQAFFFRLRHFADIWMAAISFFSL